MAGTFGTCCLALVSCSQKMKTKRTRIYPKVWGNFPTGKALAETMANVGLRDVQFFPLTFGIATLYVGTKQQAEAPTCSTN